MARMNWSRARKYSGYEEKYDPGTVLKNGRVVIAGRQHSLTTRADEILAYKKPTPKRIMSAKDWMSLKAFVASAGVATSELPGGSDGIKVAAAEIYRISIMGNMAAAIKAIPKKKRRALCKAYRTKHGLMSPKQKGMKRKAIENSDRMQAIREQLKERE